MATKSIMRRWLAPALAMTLLASAGCRRTADEDREAARTGESQLEQSKRRTEQAYDRAKGAQETARETTKQAIDEREDLIKKGQELTKDEQEMLQRQQEAQQEQQRQAQAAQQGQAADTTAAPAITATGTVETASQNEVVIRGDTGTTLRLDVDPEATTVLKDGKPAMLSDLQHGEKVKVSYRTERGQAVATRIEVGKRANEG